MPYRRALLLALLALCVGGCNAFSCVDGTANDDTSTASLTYTVLNSPQPGSTTTQISLTPSQGLNVASRLAGLEITADFTDSGGTSHEATLQLTVPTTPGTASLAESALCLDAANEECFPVSGSLSTTQFAYTCEDSFCALTVVGTLNASASWGGGNVTFDAIVNHIETFETTTSCSRQGS